VLYYQWSLAKKIGRLIDLLSQLAALSETGASTSGLAEDCVARSANNHGLGVAEDGRDVVAAGALNVHEVGVGALYETL